MQSEATTVEAYLESLPEERREALKAVRTVIVGNLPQGFEEVMQYGMISYVIPLEKYPDTYNGKPLALASLASQKNYMALYLMNVYADKNIEKWFKATYKKSGKKLNMGKSCIRFKALPDVPLSVIGEAIGKMSASQFIATYEKSRRN